MQCYDHVPTPFADIFTPSPANAEAAQLYRENMKEYVKRVKSIVEESWLDQDPSGDDGSGDGNAD